MPSFGERFKSSNRLKRPEEFKRVFASNQKVVDKTFLFLAKKNDLNRPRLGLAVPKKHIQSAVERNRLKRIIRESFRLKQKLLTGKDIVVVVREKIEVNKKSIEPVLARHWNKIIK